MYILCSKLETVTLGTSTDRNNKKKMKEIEITSIIQYRMSYIPFLGKRIKRIANQFICICGLEWMMNMIKSKLPVDSWNPKEYAKKQNIEIDHILRTTCNTHVKHRSI